MNRKFQSSEVGSRITTNSLLKTVTDWGNRVTTYEYYPDGRLSKITRPNGTVRTQQYALDGRLSRAEERTSSGHVIALYQYNYNKNGTLESRFAVPLPQSYKLPEQTFTYDNDNRIATHNAAAVTYDADGNLLTDQESNVEGLTSKVYSYNARNFLTQTVLTNSTASTNLTVSYSYDVLGNRISSTVAGGGDPGTVTFIVNPDASLSQVLVREKNGIKTYYVYGLGLEYEVSQSGAVRYYHYDQIGSTVALSDGAGQVTDRMEYSPYGTVTHRTGTNDTPFLYVGKYGVQTDANGLLYMRARYYSPLLSRFLNVDPIGFGGGLNFFAYAGGDPISFSDPQGLFKSYIHEGDAGGGTYSWNINSGMDPYYAAISAKANNGVDQIFKLRRNTSPLPFIGDQSYHFNTNPQAESGSAGDSRVVHAREWAVMAIDYQIRANEFLRNGDVANFTRYSHLSAEARGTGQHPLQDVFAHTDEYVTDKLWGFIEGIYNHWGNLPDGTPRSMCDDTSWHAGAEQEAEDATAIYNAFIDLSVANGKYIKKGF